MNAFATATGIGSWPGTTPRVAAEIVVGELPGLTHLAELPARGVGADLIGRAGALLVDIAIDTTVRGYRVTARPSAVTRRAASLLDEDIDALEEAWERAGLTGSGRPVKVQLPGPVTLAAELELGNGHRAITDAGARRDLAASLAEGAAAHARQVARRLDTTVVVQFDEPSLPAALAGRLGGVTALSTVRPVAASEAVELLDLAVAAAAPAGAGAGGPAALHCCGWPVPWEVVCRSGIDAVGLDATALDTTDYDGIGAFVESGRTVLLGLVPVITPARRPAAEEIARAAAAITDRVGLARTVLAEWVGITPTCGLAGASTDWARTAVELARRAAEVLAADPGAV